MKLLLVASLVVGSNGFSLNTNGFSRQAVRSGSFSRQQSVAPHRVAMRRTVVMANTAKEGSVVVAPDYKLAAMSLAGGVLLDTIPHIQFLGAIVTLLGILFIPSLPDEAGMYFLLLACREKSPSIFGFETCCSIS